MNLGLITSILDHWSFDEVIDTVADLGLHCVEVACWPHEKAERRYAGVCHIDTEELDEKTADHILSYSKSKEVEIAALAYYPNTMDGDLKNRAKNIAHLHSVIDAAAALKVPTVTTFIGRDQTKNVEENLELVKEIWPPILDHAKEKGIRIAIENCPMLFGPDQWPGGQNLMTSPRNWEKVFEILPYDNLGLAFDPSHFVWQMMDYEKAIHKFADRIFHVHFKDIKLNREALATEGVMAYPLNFMEPKLPGLGDVNWGRFVSALTDIRYDGYACIEAEDAAFEGSDEKVVAGLRRTADYLRNFVC